MIGTAPLRTVASRLAATLAVVTFAGLALLSGLDRLDAQGPAAPALVNWPYARNAPYNAGLLAASSHQFGQAEALMARAMDADPLDEHMIGGLGQVRLYAGNTAGADAAFRVSAQRGWRDPSTHLYWMTQSIDAGDFATAALHADALLHGLDDDRARDQILDQLLEYNGGRDALAARLRGKPRWSNTFAYAIENESIDAMAAHADVIGRTGPGIWTCQQTAALIDQLVAAGDMRDASAAHDAACAPGARRDAADDGTAVRINDNRFIQYLANGNQSVLDWRAPESNDATLVPAQAGSAHPGLQIAVSRVTMQVLMQNVIAKPGLYRLSWRMPGTQPAIRHNLLAGIACTPDLAKAVPGLPVTGQPDMVAADIPYSGDCAAPVVAFWMQPSNSPVTIDDVKLNRTGS